MKKNGFRTRLFGFCKKDVLEEVAQLSAALVAKDEEMARLLAEVEETKAAIEKTRDEEKQKLADGLLAAQRTADDLVKDAEAKAEQLLKAAEEKKAQILADAKDARKEVDGFRRQVRDVLRTMDEGLKHCTE